MTNPFEDPQGEYLVLVNAEGQHSLWPVSVKVPAGWDVVHDRDTRQACLDYIDTRWTDMRPKSLVEQMDRCPVLFPCGDYDRLELDPTFVKLREERRLLWVRPPYGDDAWLVSSYEDVKTVLSDPRFSRAAAAEHDEARLTPQPLRTSVLGMDPPDHTRLRARLANVFPMRQVKLMEPRIRETANRLLDEMITHGPPVDLVENFVMPFSGLVICALMGVPFEDRTEFRRWIDAFSSTTAMTSEEADTNMAAMHAYMARLMHRRREEPADDLVSRLVRARDEEGKLSELELVEFITVLLIAGHDTVAAALMVAVYVLLTHPEHTGQLRQRPELMPQAVQELLRYMPLDAYFTFARYATEDVELSGTVVRAGEAVLPSMPSANRDATVFDHPDALDFERTRQPHLGFGAGIHRCPGSSLATVQLEIALSALLDRFPKLRLAVAAQDVPWRAGMQVRSLERLPVEW